MESKDGRWGLFWCNLLHPIIFKEVAPKEVNRYLKKLSATEYVYPDGNRKKPGLSTLRRKLNRYEKGGFTGLYRKERNDKGKIRSVSQETVDKAIELKKEQPYRSDDTLNRFLKEQYSQTIPRSSLYRHLKDAGATKLKLGVVKKKVRKRWTRDHTNDLWVGDFEEGPYVLVDGEVLPTYLSLFIDCHSRYVVEGRYYLRQNLDILIDSLLRAWSIHGAPNELYVDNARVYHANQLKAACYELNIKLLHRTAGDPSPGGLVERIFGTCQSQFEAEVRAGDILTLNKLNKAFSAYLSVVYHKRVHSETKQEPQQRYQQGLTVIRHVDMQEVIHFFMKKDVRTVDPDFSDIRINNRFYRVEPKLRGDKVQVRFDPFSDMQKVWIYSLRDQYLCQGALYNRDYGAETQSFKQKAKPKNNFIDMIQQQHEQQLKDQCKGIDYRKVVSKRQWPFTSFVQKLAKLMGHKGDISSFNAEELETLKKSYNRFSDLNEIMLVKAFEQAPYKNIVHLIYQLQIIALHKEDS